MKKRKNIYIYITVVLFTITLVSCDLFTTREAEFPNMPRSNYQAAVTPDILISNFVNSLKDKNVENYSASFSDSLFTDKNFVFSPSSGVVSQFPSFLDNWSKKNEEQYLNNIKTKVPDNMPITLTISNAALNFLGDSIIYTASYTLDVPFIDASIPANYQGELRFSMIRDSRSVWVIYYWLDIKNSVLPSWSELKGRFFY